MSIAVIDASIGETPTQENFARELTAETTVYEASNGVLPPPVTDPSGWPHDGIVISGSKAAVYDDHGWITELQGWLQEAVQSYIPLLGVCWGHQLLAATLGGQVVSMDEYELGPRSIVPLQSGPLFPFADEFVAFQTHSDRVKTLPAGAVPLARNDYGLQAFRIGVAVGVQFHPEYDRQSMEWATESKETVDADRKDQISAELAAGGATAARQSRAIFGAFEAFVADWQPAAARTATERS